jgi:hypothetical protein
MGKNETNTGERELGIGLHANQEKLAALKWTVLHEHKLHGEDTKKHSRKENE